LAIKTFPKIFDDETTSKILREMGILEACDHKNIVRLVEAFRTEDDGHSIHLVIAPWAPCTLRDFLQMSAPVRATKCPWFCPGSPESDLVVYRIMDELADAVGYLHFKEIKHKDIKPENILLYREAAPTEIAPLLADFGVSKVFSKSAGTNYTDSTRSYLAPEQLLKHSSTLKADIWQLGCCFAHLLALVGGGKQAHERLLDSYMRSGDWDCSYIIAKEHSPFLETLAEICMRGNSRLRRVFGVVSGMLELDPLQRLDIEQVQAEFRKLPGRASV
jgi:serine/threonine protein kinase